MSTSNVVLTYTLAKSEFSLSIKNATKASYTIEYQAKKEKETVTEALTGQVSGKGTLSATHFAGTESGGAKVPHTVTGGTLKTTVTGSDNTQTEVTQIFTVSQQGQLKIVSESSETLAGSVLGASTDEMTVTSVGSAAARTIPKPVATPAALSAQDRARQETLQNVQEDTPTGLNLPIMPLAIGGGVALVLIIALLLWSMRRTSAAASAPASSSQTPPVPPTGPSV